MPSPPPGFDDMIGDAELAPTPVGEFALLVVRDVGTVRARRPMPASVPSLAMSVRPVDPEPGQSAEDAKIAETAAQQGHLMRFVREHLEDGEYERVLDAMMDGQYPADSVSRIARAVATWGNARPFVAVVSLALMSATHWRAMRTRMRGDGVADPMGLPSMHAVLDEAEKIWLEALHTGDEAKDKYERDQLFARLYAPDPDDGTPESGKPARPPGFAPHEIEADFDALTRMFGAR